jgi:hypothetical protein
MGYTWRHSTKHVFYINEALDTGFEVFWNGYESMICIYGEEE